MLIYIDDRKVEDENKKIDSATEYLNSFYKQVEAFLGNLLPDEVKLLPTNAKAVIMDNLRKRYEFPNASDKFNLDALGIDITDILSLHKQTARHWTKYKFKYSENAYTIDDKRKYLEQHYAYANTDKEKVLAFKYEELVNLYNELAELGVSVSRTGFYKAFPDVFGDVRDSEYVRIRNEKLANHLRGIRFNPRKPLKETAKEAFERLDIQPLSNTSSNT